MSPETFLHAARMSSGLSLDEIARRTRLSPRVVRALDQGRFDDLPGGLYARAYVRAFANAVAADGRVVEHELVPLLPGVEDPVSAIQAIANQAEARRRARQSAGALCLAAFIDGVVLFGIGAVLLAAVAVLSGISSGDLLSRGGGGIAALGVVAAASYFILFAGVDGRTPGRALCGLPRLTNEAPLGARQIVDRASRIFVEELSLVFTWVRRARRPAPSSP
jgi:hypothetical protein